jgi:hypothetical protein
MEVVVSAISAGIALAALVVSIVVAKRQTATQERLAAIEEARRAEEVESRGRAHVLVSVTRPEPAEAVTSTVAITAPVSWHVWLVLRNDGPALARRVEVTDEGPQAPRVMGLDILPADLQPAQPMVFPIPVTHSDHPVVRIRVRWTDEAGDHEEPYTLQVK